jgi:hypothetical protein
MASNLGCVGMDIDGHDDLGALIDRVMPAAASMGDAGGVTAWRWTDASGARLTFGIKDHALEDLVPSYAGEPGVHLSGMTLIGPEIVAADVLDADGELTTRLACDLEQWRSLGSEPAAGTAAVTALGVAVSVHADEAAYQSSPQSLLDPDGADHERPLRMATESFVSYGLFAVGEEADAHARLSGVVLSSTTLVNGCTGQDFHVARVGCLGMEIDVCVPAPEHPAGLWPGNVVAGTCYLVASVEALWPGSEPVPVPGSAEEKRRLRWFGR